jgi:hypothetical protein
VDRIVLGVDGVKYPKKGRTLRPAVAKDTGYLVVSLWKGNLGETHYVHRLVALTHIPNPNNLPEVNHLDGVRINPIVTNLEWCTRLENITHAIATGLRSYTNRLTKGEFVECLFSVIEGESYAGLSSRTPYKVPFLSTKLRKIAKELGVEGELNESLYLQRVERARTNGAKNTGKHLVN